MRISRGFESVAWLPLERDVSRCSKLNLMGWETSFQNRSSQETCPYLQLLRRDSRGPDFRQSRAVLTSLSSLTCKGLKGGGAV